MARMLYLNVVLLVVYFQFCSVSSDKTISRNIWTKTSYVLVNLNYTWTVESISLFYHSVQSPEFYAAGTNLDGFKWSLWISHHVVSRTGYYDRHYCRLTLRLNKVPQKEDKVLSTFSISVLDLKGTVIFKGRDSRSTIYNEGKAFYLDSEELYDAIGKGSLIDDTIVVECVMKIADEEKSVTSLSRHSSFDVPVCDFNEQTTKLILKDLEYSNTFFTIDSELIPVPRTLLASKSSELDRLFAASKKTNEEPIKIPLENIEKETMDFILRFAYTGESVIPDGMEIKLLDAGNKYNMSILKASSEKAVSQKVTMDNALDMLDIAEKYDANQLKQFILEFVRKNSLSMSTEEWKALVDKMTAKQCEAIAEKKCD